MDLDKIRNRIDLLDYELLRFLHERIELGLRTKRLKQGIHDKGREVTVLAQMQKYATAHSMIQADFVEKLFSLIMLESRKMQKTHDRLIGFQGDHGSFSEVAARHYDSRLTAIPCQEFKDVFEEVAQGYLDFGIVPVENSLGGAITEVNELLIKTDLKVVGGIKLCINHCLLKLPETNYRDIRVVFSHPQALTQCRDFLNRQKLENRPFYDTAGAAKMLSRSRPKNAAVITNNLCAELYNLEIVKENIQDNLGNFTRFLILAKEKTEEVVNKCSLIFSTPHKAGALFDVLKIFSEKKINLTRIESLPNREDPGNAVFFLDFQSQGKTDLVQKILHEVKKKTVMLKYLGCYQEDVFE